MSVLFRTPLLLWATALLASGEPWATWTTTQNRTFQAKFLKLHGENAIFQQEGGRVFSTPLESIHPNDRRRLQAIPAAAPTELGPPVGRPNFGHAWPRGVRFSADASSKLVSEDRKAGVFVYESTNYRFHCDASLTREVLRDFATMFETTYQFSKALPLSMQPAHLNKGKLTILLFESIDGYYRAGGPPGSAGCYNPSGQVLVPLASLGLRRVGNDFRLDTEETNHSVLIHELAHQLTPNCYYVPGARGWFSEGLAEYFAATPYNSGYFQPDAHGNAIMAYVSAHGHDGKFGRGLGKSIRVPKLRTFFLMDYASFTSNANTNYGAALLLTHYFFHMQDGGRPMRMTQYLKGLQMGFHGEPTLAPLLNGGSYEKLEGEIAEAWSRKGIQIVFGN
jgi:hypothetical protein